MNDIDKKPPAPRLYLVALPGIPMVGPGDDLAQHIEEGLARAGEQLQAGDALVIAQKIFSKAEGRYVDLATVTPSAQAQKLAAKADKDARFVELILRESRKVLRTRPGLVIVEHRLGHVMANAGIDNSNVEPMGDAERVLLLPEDPQASCDGLRGALKSRLGVDVAVVMNDSVGRAWRVGIVGMALGAAGLTSVLDLRGKIDLFGRPLAVTQVGLADELSSAASLLQGQADEGMPVVLVRGLELTGAEPPDGPSMVRPENEDLFR